MSIGFSLSVQNESPDISKITRNSMNGMPHSSKNWSDIYNNNYYPIAEVKSINVLESEDIYQKILGYSKYYRY